MNTIYAVVKIDNEINQFACRVYTKQSSNFGKMKEYKEEIKNKYLNARVVLTTREKAKKFVLIMQFGIRIMKMKE